MTVDLTKRRSDLLSDTRKLADEYEDAEYAFADVNCNVCIKFRDSFRIVQNLEQAMQLCDRFGGAKVEEDDEDDDDDSEDEP